MHTYLVGIFKWLLFLSLCIIYVSILYVYAAVPGLVFFSLIFCSIKGYLTQKTPSFFETFCQKMLCK